MLLTHAFSEPPSVSPPLPAALAELIEQPDLGRGFWQPPSRAFSQVERIQPAGDETWASYEVGDPRRSVIPTHPLQFFARTQNPLRALIFAQDYALDFIFTHPILNAPGADVFVLCLPHELLPDVYLIGENRETTPLPATVYQRVQNGAVLLGFDLEDVSLGFTPKGLCITGKGPADPESGFGLVSIRAKLSVPRSANP